MKILQTYWSLPSQTNESTAVEGRNAGGFINEKLHAMSWALSCLKFKQFYKNVKLYTDKDGMAWLIDELGLPYTDVDYSLDHLNHYNPMLWALPKVYVYGLQNEPFIHADGDVYIWKAFDETFIKQPLVVQNPEDDAEYLKKILGQLVKVFTTIPDYLLKEFNKIINFPTPGDILNVSINAGIFGGNDIEFIKKYATEAIRFVDDNTMHLNRIDVGPFNLIFEQLFFKVFAQKHNKPITYLFEEESRSNIFLSTYYFLCVPHKFNFIHLFGPLKRIALQYMQMEARLKYEFPKIHTHITQKYAYLKSYSTSNIKEENIITNHSNIIVTETFKYTLSLLKRMHLQSNQNSFDELCSFVENLLENDQSDMALLLSDVFQIEKIKQNITYSLHETECSIIETLVKQSYNNNYNFINSNLEFCLNTENTGIAYLYHQFEISPNEDPLEKVFNNNSNPILNGDINKLYIQKYIKNNVKSITYEYLEDWDILLSFFDGRYLTIKELIQEIKENNIPYTGETMETDIVDFVFHAAFNRRRLSFRERKK